MESLGNIPRLFIFPELGISAVYTPFSVEARSTFNKISIFNFINFSLLG